MEWYQLVAAYVLGFMITVFLRTLLVPPPTDKKSPQMSDWNGSNVLLPIGWPVYLPFLFSREFAKLMKSFSLKYTEEE